jgi:hypothetical protein
MSGDGATVVDKSHEKMDPAEKRLKLEMGCYLLHNQCIYN